MDKHGSYALITGGSSGIGYCYARELAAKNYHLVIVSNEDEKNRSVCKSLQQEFAVDAIPFFIDLTLPNSAEDVYRFCMERQLNIEILINNAGMFFFEEVADTSLDLSNKFLMLNVVTPTLLATLFSKYMREKKAGFILITASVTAWMPYPGIALYSATKRYLKNFARSLRYELKSHNVSVTVVCPGAVDTSLYSLNNKYRKLALRLRIMIDAKQLAAKAVKAMLNKRFLLIPGLMTKISVLVVMLIPPFIIHKIKLYLWKRLGRN
ncbi:MAG TPA: SDR family NAD(P)-dependent oxidoreductase [Bacteroidales bacterium]|jgi:hypothetical protein|nr:SDR family NAD(P)-dependent oxidoreductase [Bacteroidales bacterium]